MSVLGGLVMSLVMFSFMVGGLVSLMSLISLMTMRLM